MPRTATLVLLIALTPFSDAHAAKRRVPQDFASIQAAINVAAAGDVVEIAEGTYAESLVIALKNDLTVRACAGDQVVVDGGGLTAVADVESCTGLVIECLRFRNASSVGLVLSQCEDVTIRDCRVEQVGAGIVFENSQACRVQHCRLKNLGGDGILVLNCDSCLLDENTIQDGAAEGISLAGNGNTVEHNRIRDVAGDGVRLATPSTDTLVVDNRIEAVSDGIRAEQVTANNTILDNVIRETQLNGVELALLATGYVVDGNVVHAAGDSGLLLEGSDSLASRNRLKKSQQVGITVEAAATGLEIVLNKVTGTVFDGIDLRGSGNALVKNVAKKSGGFDLHINGVPGLNVLVANTFSSVGVTP